MECCQHDKTVGCNKFEQKRQQQGTEAYDSVLHLLGIDIEPLMQVTNLGDIIDLNVFQVPSQLEYPHLSTPEHLQALADQIREYPKCLNESTLVAHMMKHIFIPVDIPKQSDEKRSSTPCQILEFPGAFTGYNRFNRDIYNFVRGSKAKQTPSPNEADLRCRSNLTFMAYKNAMGKALRRLCADYPGVHNKYNAIAPFLSVEFKVNDQTAMVREAVHQVAISSFVCLVERQRLPRPDSPYIDDNNIRHYAYTICGSRVTVWITTLQMEEKHHRCYTTYKVQRLVVLDLDDTCSLEEFLQWHRYIMTWGLSVYVPEYVRDLERVIGAPRRVSLETMILSTKKVTQSLSSDGVLEVDDEDTAAEYPATEDQATENSKAEYPTGPVTEDPATESTVHASMSTPAQNPHRWLNSAAVPLSKITDRAMVRAYLTRLVKDIESFIKQLDKEEEGRRVSIKGKAKENTLASNVGERPQGLAIVSNKSSTEGRGNIASLKGALWNK